MTLGGNWLRTGESEEAGLDEEIEESVGLHGYGLYCISDVCVCFLKVLMEEMVGVGEEGSRQLKQAAFVWGRA